MVNHQQAIKRREHQTRDIDTDDAGREVETVIDWDGETVRIQRLRYDWVTATPMPATSRAAASLYLELFEGSGIREPGGASMVFINSSGAPPHPMEAMTGVQLKAYRDWRAARKCMPRHQAEAVDNAVLWGGHFHGRHAKSGLSKLANHFRLTSSRACA